MFDVGLAEIVAALGGELIGRSATGQTDARIDRLGALDDAGPTTLTYLALARLRPLLAQSQAGGVIVGPEMRDAAQARGLAIVTDSPHLYFARLTQWWVARTRAPAPPGVHPSAVVDPTARLGARVSIGPLAVVEAHAWLDDDVVVGTHTCVGAHVRLGAGVRLAARVTLGERCSVGARTLVHSGAVIGADGFGFAPTPDGRWEKIEQLGAVQIGEDVEIGANTCIDRGALGDTVIEHGAKLDNLIQIGHNVRIGAHTALAGCVGIAGSTVVGKHCTIGGAGMIVGHIEIADHVHISGGTLVMRSIKKPGLYTGVFPMDDNAAWEKNAATLRHLHTLRDRVRALEKAAAGGGATHTP